MKRPTTLADLGVFARECLDADRFPGDAHVFSVARCQDCGAVPLELTIVHHSGSEEGDFKGQIFARCMSCHRRHRIFSFTGRHREPVRELQPMCRCGGAGFFVAECERIERGEGLPGFFDEGVVVAKCAECGCNQALVYTD